MLTVSTEMTLSPCRCSDPGGKVKSALPVVALATAPSRQIELPRSSQITIHTGHSGGWYDIALTT
jgi:hypothetical protein